MLALILVIGSLASCTTRYGIVSAKGKITVVEFAYMVKSNEEADRDCDDAERILKVIYKTFLEMITFRLAGEENTERFRQVYRQQLMNFYKAFADIDVIKKKDGGKNEALFTQLVDWLNQNGLFLTISDNAPLDEHGNLAIDRPFDWRSVLSGAKKAETSDAE